METQPKRAWLHRIGKAYTTIAVIGFNVMVVFVVGVFIISALLPKTDALAEQNKDKLVPVGVHAAYSERFNRAGYYFMTPPEVEVMLADYDRMAAEGHWQVHPWTGLTMRPFVGKYLNIGRDGERFVPPPSPDHAGLKPLMIWAFGGSTQFGWGVADAYSVPALLQTALQERLPDRQVQVINFAVPIYNSSQELALFAASLRQMKPHIAVFMDGVNDVWYTMYANTQTALVDPLAGVWENYTASITSAVDTPWVTINPSFPPLRLAQQMGLNLSQIKSPSDFPVQYAMQGIYTQNETEQLDYAVQSYNANRAMGTAIGNAMGVSTYYLLQPYADTKFYPGFMEGALAAGDENLYDVSDTFELADYSDHILLIDDFHYSDYASEILAGRIADIIMQRENF
ncbi:MAG: hypothetical protein K8L97_20180 [Anaerolineae bacterium]|nr:hypothetical protein [Anaerolineae bacterium]